jgi:hypothetical protein
MKSTSKLYFNSYESTGCTPSLASASSGSRKYHSWVTWFYLKGLWWTRQGEGGLGMEAANDSVLGLAGYYRRFILNFSKITKPITELLKKGNKYVWSEACDEAFKPLKKLLTTSPMLAQPNTTKPFNIYCDASGTSLGGVLMQEG